MRAVFCLCLLVPVSLGAERPPSYGGNVRMGLPGEPVRIDPLTGRWASEFFIADLLFDSLYSRDNPGGALASGPPQRTKEGFYVPIRKDVRFHDGALLTSYDVARSVKRWQREGYFTKISVRTEKGGVLFIGAEENIGETLAHPALIVTKGGTTPRWGKAVGTGPFSLGTYSRRTRQVTLVRNERYFGGPPFLEKVTLQWFRSEREHRRAFETSKLDLSTRGKSVFPGGEPAFAYRKLSAPILSALFLRPCTGTPNGSAALAAIQMDLRALRRLAGTPTQRFPSRGLSTGNVGSTELRLMYDQSQQLSREIAEKVAAFSLKSQVQVKLLPVSRRALEWWSNGKKCDVVLEEIPFWKTSWYEQWVDKKFGVVRRGLFRRSVNVHLNKQFALTVGWEKSLRWSSFLFEKITSNTSERKP